MRRSPGKHQISGSKRVGKREAGPEVMEVGVGRERGKRRRRWKEGEAAQGEGGGEIEGKAESSREEEEEGGKKRRQGEGGGGGRGVHTASTRLGSLDESEEGVCIGSERDPGPARPIAALGDRARKGRGPRRAEECASNGHWGAWSQPLHPGS